MKSENQHLGHKPLALIIDASCDLPEALLAANPHVGVLPVEIHVGQQTLIDDRSAAATQAFYRQHLGGLASVSAYSSPLSQPEMETFFAQHAALAHDQALGVFVASSRSAIFARARLAAASVRMSSYATRLRAGNTEPLHMDCVDSQTLFAGLAVQVLDVLQFGLATHDQGGAQAFARSFGRWSQVKAHTHAWLAPFDVDYILKRAAHKGEKSVSGLAAFAAKALSVSPIIHAFGGETATVGKRMGVDRARASLFQTAARLIETKALLSPNVCFSFSGELSDIENLPGFKSLVALAKTHGVGVHLSLMSMTGSINVGPKALSLGVIAHNPKLM